jgi:hypothetical protein
VGETNVLRIAASLIRISATGEPMWNSYYFEVGGPGALGGFPDPN